MGNSDTDSESECFESAEESLDEEEEVKSLRTKSKKSESEVVEPVPKSDKLDSGNLVEKEISSNLSYRKRPERVKRTLSNTATKPVTKSPSNEFIFKPDKIVPDAFFQDITSNLSKNINKSLSTLQQKSSNVKDMILSSLPVSSVNDSESFVYDDTPVQPLPNESELEVSKPKSQNYSSKEPIKKVIKQDEKKEKNNSIKEKPEEKNISTVNRSTNKSKEQKSPNAKKENLDIKQVGDSNLDDNTAVNSEIKEVSSGTVKEKQSVSSNHQDNNKIEESCVKESKMLPKIKEKDIEQTEETFCQQKETSTTNNDKTDSVDHSNITKPEISESVSTKSEPTEAKSKKTEQNEKHSESEVLNSKLNSSQPEKIQQAQISETLSENKSENLEKKESEVDSKCNLEELKTALENIVKQEEKTSPIENEFSKENIEEEEKENNTKDGWDDFDFSDNEVENIKTENSTSQEITIKESEGHKTETAAEKTSLVKEPIADTLSKNNTNLPKKEKEKLEEDIKESKNITKPKEDAKIEELTQDNWEWGNEGEETHIKKSENATDTTADDNWDWGDEDQKTTKKPEETEPTDDDNWDWNAWDETPENSKPEVETPLKSKTETPKKESSDLGKWTGWDTFAQKPQEKQGNWGLGSWGVDMLLNKATAVTQGISNVLEAGLGAPDPETLARMEKLEKEKQKELEPDDIQEQPDEIPKKNSLTNVNLFPVSGITSLVAGVTSKIVEHSKIQEIGSKVITGGLDTLETFGKKTMEVLQEGDPGLKNKRALLMGSNKPVLSQVLKEVREKAENEMKKAEEKEMAKKCHFETLFDDFQGMVHLEALEMLSRQCELKLEQLKSAMNSEEREDLNGILEEVEQLCALDECDLDMKSSVLEFKTNLQMAVEPLKNEISVHKIVQIHENVNKWLETSSETKPSLVLINQKLVATIAELAAATVHQFHKSGELLSVKECRKTVEEVDALSRLTNIMCNEINTLCDKFILLSRSRSNVDVDNLKSMSEKVSLIMKNSTSYIRQAFDLLIPVLQLGAAV